MKKIFYIFILLIGTLALPQSSEAHAAVSTKKVQKKVIKKAARKKIVLASQQYPQVKATVPFYIQTIGGSWSDPKLADGCEEAAILMATAWATDRTFTAREAHDYIISLSDYELEKYGFFEDTSAADTMELMRARLGVNGLLSYDISVEEIKKVILSGNIAIIPVNGDKLNNPNYASQGPVRHTVVVTGYIPETNQFILNDPGTRSGQSFVVNSSTLQNSLQDYPSGKKLKVKVIRPAMIEVYKQAVIQQ